MRGGEAGPQRLCFSKNLLEQTLRVVVVVVVGGFK